jgi:hypothetical protein
MSLAIEASVCHLHSGQLDTVLTFGKVTVAIGSPSVDTQLVLDPSGIRPVYEAGRLEGTDQRRTGPSGFKHFAAEARKEVAEALRDVLVMVAGVAVKRTIWGYEHAPEGAPDQARTQRSFFISSEAQLKRGMPLIRGNGTARTAPLGRRRRDPVDG